MHILGTIANDGSLRTDALMRKVGPDGTLWFRTPSIRHIKHVHQIGCTRSSHLSITKWG
jgi:hypothetical protein